MSCAHRFWSRIDAPHGSPASILRHSAVDDSIGSSYYITGSASYCHTIANVGDNISTHRIAKQKKKQQGKHDTNVARQAWDQGLPHSHYLCYAAPYYNNISHVGDHKPPQKLRKSHWCVPFTATFSKRRKIGASWSERCDAELKRAVAHLRKNKTRQWFK